MFTTIEEIRAFLQTHSRDQVMRWKQRMEKASISDVLAQEIAADMRKHKGVKLSVKDTKELCRKGARLIAQELPRLEALKAQYDESLRETARGAIERHIGDVCEGEESADSIYDEAYTLAFDRLRDDGVDVETARRIAEEEAQKIAQP